MYSYLYSIVVLITLHIMGVTGILFPGTKWCGQGNDARHYFDLGSERDTDACCREHDYCDDTMDPETYKHNLYNDGWFTRLHCSCDNKFYSCLQRVNTKTSTLIGIIYFDLFSAKCYKEEYPIVCKVYRDNIFYKSCARYAYDTSQEKIYQWYSTKSFWF